MRQVFSNPEPFIDACIKQGSKAGLTGFNIDWEPTVDATAQDAMHYAQFLTLFTNTLNQHGLQVSHAAPRGLVVLIVHGQ
jgi:spore germination protein YaaH